MWCSETAFFRDQYMGGSVTLWLKEACPTSHFYTYFVAYIHTFWTIYAVLHVNFSDIYQLTYVLIVVMFIFAMWGPKYLSCFILWFQYLCVSNFLSHVVSVILSMFDIVNLPFCSAVDKENLTCSRHKWKWRGTLMGFCSFLGSHFSRATTCIKHSLCLNLPHFL